MRPPPIHRALLPHRVIAEPPTGDGAHVGGYGPGVVVACWHDGQTGSARDKSGATVTTTGSLLARPEHADALAVGARITDSDGRVSYVVALERNDGGGLVPLSHVRASIA